MTDNPEGAERVLVFGDDGSPGADVAWLWVCNHPWPGWRAEVVTAVEPAVAVVDDEAAARASARDWVSPHPRLLVAQSQLASVRTLRVDADRRLALAARHEADLLVVGPGRLRPRTPLSLGSTADWLLHYPPAPVALIRSATPVRRVAVGVDGSHHALAALRSFAALPWAAATEVDLISVDEGRGGGEPGVAEARAVLHEAGVEARIVLRKGHPTQQILDHLDSHDIQLVVLGTRGLSGWQRLRLGSTAGTVARSATCSALVALAPEPAPEG